MKPGDSFKITKRSHWAYGRAFTCTDLPGLEVKGNRDQAPLSWKPGELVEFRVAGQAYLIPVEWTK